ncbi:hypothetical protein ACOMHN_037377 [Nucella lapillus]
MDPRFRHPFTSVIAGPTSCRKTEFVKKFIEYKEEGMDPPPDEVVWCFEEWQPGYGELKIVRFVEGIPDVEDWNPGKRLLVLDDPMTERTKE